MQARNDITVRAVDGRDSLEAWEADIRRIDEGLRCVDVLAWAKAPVQARKVLMQRLGREMARLEGDAVRAWRR